MKAITVKQPWAQLICAGIKDIENRTWKTNFRGRVLIHASAKPERVTLEMEGQATVKEIEMMSALNFAEENNLFGCIIGSVEIVDCVINHPSIWAEKSNPSPDWTDGAAYFRGEKPTYNWVLANPVLFDKPIENVKGKLSFWESWIETDTCLECNNRCQIVIDEKANQYVPDYCKHR